MMWVSGGYINNICINNYPAGIINKWAARAAHL